MKIKDPHGDKHY